MSAFAPTGPRSTEHRNNRGRTAPLCTTKTDKGEVAWPSGTQASARDAIRTFHSEASARAWLHEQVKVHDLNPEWLGLGAWSAADPVSQEVHEAHFEAALEDWRNVASGWFVESDAVQTSAA